MDLIAYIGFMLKTNLVDFPLLVGMVTGFVALTRRIIAIVAGLTAIVKAMLLLLLSGRPDLFAALFGAFIVTGGVAYLIWEARKARHSTIDGKIG